MFGDKRNIFSPYSGEYEDKLPEILHLEVECKLFMKL